MCLIKGLLCDVAYSMYDVMCISVAGYATRMCQTGGVWSEVENITCLSITGQNLLTRAVALEGGQQLSLEQLTAAVGELRGVVSVSESMQLGGDVHISGRLLEQYVQLLLSHLRNGAAVGTMTVLEVKS